MNDSQWPDTGRHRPRTVSDHSASLKADFDNVHNTVKASVSRVINLPANLRAQSAKGVTNGIAEAESNGHCSKFSEMDRDTFTNIILRNITTQTAAGAPDTVPLTQFYGPHECYQELHAKLMAQMPDTAADNRLIAVVNGTNIVEIKSSSANIILNIVHQASVNIMEGRDSRYLGEAISVLLEAYFSNDWFKGSVRLSTASLLDSGDVKVVAHAEYREDLDRLIQSTAWHEEFEESLDFLPKQTYNIRMHNIRIDCMMFRNRIEKSIIIRALAETNFLDDSDSSVRSSSINDIARCGKKLRNKKEKGPPPLW